MRPARVIGAALLALSAGLLGCNIVSAIAYFFGPPQIQKAEYQLTGGRLAVLGETARSVEKAVKEYRIAIDDLG
jgi:cytochrome c-type biogenesis protein CcmE